MNWYQVLKDSCKKINETYAPDLKIRLEEDPRVDGLLDFIVFEFNRKRTEIISSSYYETNLVKKFRDKYIDIVRLVSDYSEFNLGRVSFELIEKHIDKLEPYSGQVFDMIDDVVALIAEQRR